MLVTRAASGLGLAAVRSLAHEFAAGEPRLDVLVNNAGVMPDERTRSRDGRLGAGPDSERDCDELWTYCEAALAATGIGPL